MKCFGSLLLVCCTISLFGCRPLYVPFVPEGVPPQPRFRVDETSGLTLSGDRLQLVLAFDELPNEGWLALQWFDPKNREVASESFWVVPSQRMIRRRLDLPHTVPLSSGEWRVVVSFGSHIIRQFSIVIGDTG
jgi:hypothetical protein